MFKFALLCSFALVSILSCYGAENDSLEIKNIDIIALQERENIDNDSENIDILNLSVEEGRENVSIATEEEILSPDDIARRKLREFNPGLLEFIENALKMDQNKMTTTPDEVVTGPDNVQPLTPGSRVADQCNATDYYTQPTDVCRLDEVYFRVGDVVEIPEPHCKCATVNAFYYETPALKIIQSDEFVELLNRNITNLCVLALFYAPWCPFSAKFSPIVNTLGRAFPTLTSVAVDANENKNLDSKYGVVGVPQLLMFYNGKLVIRFHSRHFNEIIKGINNSTGLDPEPNVTIEKFGNMGPLPCEPAEERDVYLWFSCLIVFSFTSALFVHSTDVGRKIWSVAGFVQPLPDIND